jgi:hypothetical protein
MSEPNSDRAVLVLRVIVLAMGVGVVSFLAVVVLLVTGGQAATDPRRAAGLLPALGIASAAAAGLYLVARRGLTGKLRRFYEQQAGEAPPSQLVTGFATLTIVGAGLAEGPSFFGAVVFYLSGSWLALGVPVLGLLMLALIFPSRRMLHAFASQVTGRYWDEGDI